MHTLSSLEEIRWPNLDVVEREIADVSRRQILLQDKLSRHHSLCGAVANRVRALISGTDYHKEQLQESKRLSCEESQLRRAKLRFVLESTVSNLPILNSKAQTGHRLEEKEETVLPGASHSWSLPSSRPSAVRHSGSAKTRGGLENAVIDTREYDSSRRPASQPSANIAWRTWYKTPHAVLPGTGAGAGDAVVPCDGMGWLHRLLRGGFQQKTRQEVAFNAISAQRDVLKTKERSDRHDRGVRCGIAGVAEAAFEVPPAAVMPTARATGLRGANVDEAARRKIVSSSRRREAATTVKEPHQTRPVSICSSSAGRLTDSALEKMHNFLSSSFAVPEPGADSACRRKSLVLAAAAAESRGGVPANAEKKMPPSVWVRGYLDESNKYGLGFVLADGSIGVRLKAGVSLVLDPEGVTFDYIEHARRPSSKGGGGGRGGSEGKPARTKYTLEDFPSRLKKDVKLLRFVRGRLGKLGRSHAVEATQALAEDGARSKDSDSARRGKTAKEPLVFVKRFRRTRRTLLFQLSNGTVQVIFGDHTEILLSEGAGLITYVRRDGQRETFTCRRVLDERRADVNKRLRHSTFLIAGLLGRT